jgi:predicted metal-dependent hydrolase
LGEHRIEYSVVKGRSRRYTYFRFGPDMTLEIVVPRGGVKDLDSVIRDRRTWILKQYQKMLRNRRVLDEEALMFDGNHLKIVFERVLEKEELQPEPERGEVIIRTNERSRTRELVRRWFLKETSKYVVRRVGELSRELGLRYRVADVREIRNWGYCTKSGRLSFSWQLIALPERLRDYVVLHELSHLDEFNHSAAFKKRLAVLCPDYRDRERELAGILPM